MLTDPVSPPNPKEVARPNRKPKLTVVEEATLRLYASLRANRGKLVPLTLTDFQQPNVNGVSDEQD